VHPNPFSLARRGALTIAGQQVTIAQGGRRTDRNDTDFNGDGQADLLFHDQESGQVGVWVMSGVRQIDGFVLTPDRVPDTRWQIVGAGDFNSDAQPDIVWQHEIEGWLAVWTMNGTRREDVLFLDPPRFTDAKWRVRAVADMNGDTRPDLVLQHPEAGWVGVWNLNGRQLVDGRLFSVPATDSAWQIVGAADLNADGWSDLVFQHDLGALATWLMRGSERQDVVFLRPGQVPHPTWRVRAVTDLDFDGQPDLIMQRATTGELAAWLMDGTRLIDGVFLTPRSVPHPSWRLSGPR
jgi:hypothetical protein